ncbi:hypothetical protein G6321_00039410 [Bradyrhizobium barranii subsp. barranii]|uniref:Uncharacterized protein n=1 Tax=Bradyrhizobium barranii subsp. barranii TaxID=2823807 RepID=A0A7Z0QF50_9BRAD|nr:MULTISPECIES: hypothetical protein [Bradyrhizobium]UEM17944.1 hypothetical protein J4G43_053000 [Bradyrhizobium barranii subsp. barranii]UGX91761.1 hypothetical protein G6321_00039410 [Bradyrhizobium barranii subsp. barranii]UQE03608.1 hypothetical protein JEY30_47615 [Bradyrhizobium japonicum]
MRGSYWEYAGNHGSMQWLEYVSSWRLPGNAIECKMVSDGFGFTFRGDIERVRRWLFTPAGLARISDPLDRAKHLTDAYQRTTTPCAIGMPKTTQTDVEKMLQRIAAGPAVVRPLGARRMRRQETKNGYILKRAKSASVRTQRRPRPIL